MTDQLNGATTLISGVTYGAGNQILSIAGILNETRAYNNLQQLTSLSASGGFGNSVAIQYGYSATQNNGKITSQTDTVSGEQITYTYDALNRLASAVTSDNPNVTQWGQSYNYDGFGNLTDQNVIKGSAPTLHVVYSAANNRAGDPADANGNIGNYTYDIENRIVQVPLTTVQYAYDAGNKRVWRGDVNNSLDEIAFYGVGGEKLGTYSVFVNGTTLKFYMTGTRAYLGGKLLAEGTNLSGNTDHVQLTPVAADRLGSIGKFYPYGQERPSATTNDTEKFTGYYRDASTGLDYADQRYEQPGAGRFMSPDTIGGGVTEPGSWNKYAYTRGDPINRTDANGTCDSEFCVSITHTEYLGGTGIVGMGGGATHYVSEQQADNLAQATVERNNERRTTQALNDSKGRIAEDLAKPDCAKDFKNPAAVAKKVGSAAFSDQGAPRFHTEDGAIVPDRRSPNIAKYNPFTKSIRLNSGINWLDPSNTSATLDGQSYTYDALAAEAALLGLDSITAQQFMDISLLHELAHYNGKVGNPDNAAVEVKLWNDCIK